MLPHPYPNNIQKSYQKVVTRQTMSGTWSILEKRTILWVNLLQNIALLLYEPNLLFTFLHYTCCNTYVPKVKHYTVHPSEHLRAFSNINQNWALQCAKKQDQDLQRKGISGTLLGHEMQTSAKCTFCQEEYVLSV